jgi:hypothetical protein
MRDCSNIPIQKHIDVLYMPTCLNLAICNRLLEAPRASVGELEVKVSMHLLPFLVDWLNLDRQVCPPNQLAMHWILFKGMARRPEDYVRREQHEQGGGQLNWVGEEHWRRHLVPYLYRDHIKRQHLSLDDP